MTSQRPWLDFFLSKMAKNSKRKVALSLVSVPHMTKKKKIEKKEKGKKKAASYCGLLGMPFSSPLSSASLLLELEWPVMELLKCTVCSGLLLQGPQIWSCLVVHNSSWWGYLSGNSGGASCQFPPEGSALCHWFQCHPLGKMCGELGMLPNNRSFCLPASFLLH